MIIENEKSEKVEQFSKYSKKPTYKMRNVKELRHVTTMIRVVKWTEILAGNERDRKRERMIKRKQKGEEIVG